MLGIRTSNQILYWTTNLLNPAFHESRDVGIFKACDILVIQVDKSQPGSLETFSRNFSLASFPFLGTNTFSQKSGKLTQLAFKIAGLNT